MYNVLYIDTLIKNHFAVCIRADKYKIIALNVQFLINILYLFDFLQILSILPILEKKKTTHIELSFYFRAV